MVPGSYFQRIPGFSREGLPRAHHARRRHLLILGVGVRGLVWLRDGYPSDSPEHNCSTGAGIKSEGPEDRPEAFYRGRGIAPEV